MALQYNLVTPSPAPIQSLTGALVGLGGIQLGLDATNNFAVAPPTGLAICRGDGTCVAIDADADALIDVTPMVIPGVSPCVVRLPVQVETVRRGDLLITSDSPFSALFVLKAPEGAYRIRCLDPFSDEIVTYVPPRSGVLPMTWVVIAISPFSSLLCGERPRRDAGREKERGEDELGMRDLALAALLSQPSINASVTQPAGGGATTVTGPSGLAGLSGAWLLPLLLEGDFLGARHDGGGSRGLLFALLISSLLSQSPGTPASGSPAATSALGQLAPLLLLMLGRGRKHGDEEVRPAGEREHGERGERSFGNIGLLLASILMQGQGLAPAAGGTTPTPVTAGVTGTLSTNPAAMLLAALAGFTGFRPRSRHDRDEDADASDQNDEEDGDDLDHDGDAGPAPPA